MKTRRKKPDAFSLIELLAATVVLGLIVLMVTQLVVQSSRIIRDDTRRMDAFSVARIVFDRIGMDWEGRIRVGGGGYFVDKQPGDDALALYSQAPAYSGTRSMASALGYRIAAHPVWGRTLERAALGYYWPTTDPTPDNNPVFLRSTEIPTLDETDFEAVGQGIIRFEVAFLVRDNTGEIVWRGNAPAPTDDLRALGLYLVTVDTSLMPLLGESAVDRTLRVQELGEAFPDAIDLVDTALEWQAILNDPTALAQQTGVPLIIPQSMRSFQRIVPIQ